MNDLIRCITCDEVFLKTPFDRSPEYEPRSTAPLESFQTIERDDLQDFLRDHQGHRLEDLKILEDSFISEKEYFEPVKTSYFKATNGKESFVIKKFRETIEEPVKYQLIHGDYSLTCSHIEAQSKDIEKQLKSEPKTSGLPQNKIDGFLKLLEYITRAVDIEKLERVSEESPNPLNIYYKLDDISLVYLLRNCRNIFNGQEYLAVEEFIDRHKNDGVLLLKATYKIQITKTAKSRKVEKPRLREALSTPLPLKSKKFGVKKD